MSSLRKIWASDSLFAMMITQASFFFARALAGGAAFPVIGSVISGFLLIVALALRGNVIAHEHFFAFISGVLAFPAAFPGLLGWGWDVGIPLAILSVAIRSELLASNAKAFRKLFMIFPERRIPLVFSHAMILVFALAYASALIFTPFGQRASWLGAADAVLLVVITVLQCLNPLTAREKTRLDGYFREAGRADANARILENIKGRIESRWIKRYDLPIVENVIMFFVRVFFHLRINGADNIKDENLPVVFVSNHGLMIGPVCGVTYLPVVHRPYVHHRMCDAQESAQRMWRWTFSPKLAWMGQERGLKFSRFIARRVTKWINSYEPVKSYVDLGDARKSMESLRNGAFALMSGDSVLLFPEDSSKAEGGTYQHGEAGAFFVGFAHMGKIYNEMTGRSLSFYPVFVDKKTRSYNIAQPVIYDNKANVSIEKRRVAEELRRRMNSYCEE